MNSDILKGKWKQAKGSIQATWGDITDDDLDKIDGNRERLEGLLQEKYGKRKDEVEHEVDEYLKRLN